MFDSFDMTKVTDDEKECIDKDWDEYRLKRIPKYYIDEHPNNIPQFGDIICGDIRLSNSYWVRVVEFLKTSSIHLVSIYTLSDLT